MESLESLSHGPPWLPLQTAAVLSPTQSPKELMGRELELGWCMESWNLHDTLIDMDHCAPRPWKSEMCALHAMVCTGIYVLWATCRLMLCTHRPLPVYIPLTHPKLLV